MPVDSAWNGAVKISFVKPPTPLCEIPQEVDRHHVHEVHQEHEAEDRDRQRRDQLAAAVEGLAHQAVDEADDDLDDRLELARHARRRLARRAQEEEDEQRGQHEGEEQRVHVQGHERAVAHADLQVVQVVVDVFGRAGAGRFARGGNGFSRIQRCRLSFISANR
jgi:hypothetical protein